MANCERSLRLQHVVALRAHSRTGGRAILVIMSLHNRSAVSSIFTELALGAWGLVALLIVANVAARINNFAAITGERYKISDGEHPSQAQSLSAAPSPEHDIRSEAPRAQQSRADPAPHVLETIAPAQPTVEAAPEVVGTVPQPGAQAAPDVRETIAPAQAGPEPPHVVLETIAPAEPPPRPAREVLGTAKAEAKRKKPVTQEEQPLQKQQPLGGDRSFTTNY